MAAPMFSIIIPTLNVATTLRVCLDSIARQTCTDFELVVVDGGSTDGTLDITKSFTSHLGARLIIHCGTDQGVYDAMNRGVGLATGTWVLFLGGDDSLYETGTLSEVASFIAEHERSDLVYGDVIMRSTSFRRGGVFDLDTLLLRSNISHQAIFYRRELFDSIGPYNLRYPVLADWDFNIRCFSNPALVTRYMPVVVSRFNEFGGLCTSVVDKEFLKRLPRSSRFQIRAIIAVMRLVRVTEGWRKRRSQTMKNSALPGSSVGHGVGYSCIPADWSPISGQVCSRVSWPKTWAGRDKKDGWS